MGYLQEFFRPKIFKYKYNKNSVIHGIPRPVFCISGWLRRPKFAFALRFHYLYGKIRNSMTDFRIGHGYDVHALADGLPLVLGGIEIPHTKGFVAHSDGDVAIHAVCDALLGAAALGDIGMHFPDTSDDFKGIDSKILLRRVAALLREKGYEIGNVDCTIRMQRPKLRPHIDAMRTAMAGAMGVGDDRVSVKATTTEHLGFEGREEGVSVSAVALIYKMQAKPGSGSQGFSDPQAAR